MGLKLFFELHFVVLYFFQSQYCEIFSVKSGNYYLKEDLQLLQTSKLEVVASIYDVSLTKCQLSCNKNEKCESVSYEIKSKYKGVCNMLKQNDKGTQKLPEDLKNIYKEVKLQCTANDYVIYFKQKGRKVPSIKKTFPDLKESSVCLWFKVSKMPKTRSTLFALNHDSATGSCNAHYQLVIFDNKFSISYGKNSPFFTDKVIKAKENAWTHVCLLRKHIHDKLSYRYFLYVNATRVGFLESKYTKDSGLEEEHVINIGGEYDVEGEHCVIKNEKKLFLGKISKLYMFDKLLSQDEIKLLHQNEKIIDNLIVDWKEFNKATDGVNSIHQECEFMQTK